jgi:dTDP-4-amino-4,6-dideoxygalactose transaminase
MDEIPFVNLSRQVKALRPELLSAVEEVLSDRTFILGKHVQGFEDNFAAAHGVSHGIGCASGTAAIFLILKALGIQPGDEVIVPSHTFIASASAVCHAGATPVFADIEPRAYTLDPASVAEKLSPRTRAIMPVHIYGTPCRLDLIADLGRSTQASVIEDAAQAHLASYNGRHVGSWGDAATFSFYPGKNLGAFGDAGMVVTNDAALAQHVRLLRDHGRQSKYVHEIPGYNYRMDGLQAAFLSVKLRYLARWNDRRREVAARYDDALQPLGFKVIEPHDVSAYHLYVVEVSNRDEVQTYLKERGIATGVHYPVPLHRQPAFRELGSASLPVTETIVQRILSLPICGEISDSEQARVIETFLEVARP